MNATVRFQSVPTDLANLLHTLLAEHPQPYTTGITVGTRIPDDRTIDEGTPLIVVTQSGPGAVRSSVHQVSSQRILAWHRTRDLTDDLIQHVYALAGMASGNGTQIRSVLPGTAPWVTTDPDTGTPLGEFTCTVNSIGQTWKE